MEGLKTDIEKAFPPQPEKLKGNAVGYVYPLSRYCSKGWKVSQQASQYSWTKVDWEIDSDSAKQAGVTKVPLPVFYCLKSLLERYGNISEDMRQNSSQNKLTGPHSRRKTCAGLLEYYRRYALIEARQVVDAMHLKTSKRRLSGAQARTLWTGSGADTDPAGHRTTAVCGNFKAAPTVWICSLVSLFQGQDCVMLLKAHQLSE